MKTTRIERKEKASLRTTTIVIRVSEQDRGEFQARADVFGLSLSSWIRMVLLAALRRRGVDAGKQA
jgi:hypothetical protein